MLPCLCKNIPTGTYVVKKFKLQGKIAVTFKWPGLEFQTLRSILRIFYKSFRLYQYFLNLSTYLVYDNNHCSLLTSDSLDGSLTNLTSLPSSFVLDYVIKVHNWSIMKRFMVHHHDLNLVNLLLKEMSL